MNKFKLFLSGEISSIGEILFECVKILFVSFGASLDHNFLKSFEFDMNDIFFNIEALNIFESNVDNNLFHEGLSISMWE